MRRIVNSTYITLDGVIADPQDWPSSEVSDEAGGAIQTELLFASDALLMGRRTYESFAAAWPSRSDPFSDRMNGMAKHVVSSTLQAPAWANTRVIGGDDPVAEIARLKAQPGQDIVQYGFGQLAFALLEHGLLDELRLWVSPLILGRGGTEGLLYRATGAPARLRFESARPLKNGDVILTYAP